MSEIRGKPNNELELIDKREMVANLIRMACGKRSFRAYARDAGVSVTTISRILNGDFLPKPDTIRKLTSEEAAPQNGVTYELLMQAAGYSPFPLKPELMVKLGNLEDVYVEFRESSNGRELHHYEYCLNAKLLEKECSSVIYTALVEKNLMFKRINHEDGTRRGYMDLEIELFENPIKTWTFIFRHMPKGRPHQMDLDRLYAMMGGALTFPVSPERKHTIVVDNQKLFDEWKKYERSLSFRGELSIALFDFNEKEFKEEIYLSNYELNDTSKEIYLV